MRLDTHGAILKHKRLNVNPGRFWYGYAALTKTDSGKFSTDCNKCRHRASLANALAHVVLPPPIASHVDPVW